MQFLVLLPLFLLPLVVKANFILTIFIFAFILGILAVGLNVIFGYAGQLSMFQGASFGLGAYATYLVSTQLGLSFWLALVVSGVFVVLISLIVGAICFRSGVRAFYFALITLAFAELARLIVLNWSDVTKGAQGLMVLDPISISLPGYQKILIDDSLSWYYLSLVVLTIGLLLCAALMRSSVGRSLSAIRLNEDLAQTLGINTFRYKLFSFVVADLYAVVAGSLYGFYSTFIDPSYLSLTQSLDTLTMLLLGGVGTLFGPILGALLLTGLPHTISIPAEARLMLIGAILIFVILVMPKGIAGSVQGLFRRGGRDVS